MLTTSALPVPRSLPLAPRRRGRGGPARPLGEARWLAPLGVLAVLVASLGTLVAGPAVAFAVAVVGIAVGAALMMPPGRVLCVLVFFMVVFDNTLVRPADGEYRFFLHPVGKIVFENLNPLKANVIDLTMSVLVVRVLLQVVHAHRSGRVEHGIVAPPRPFAIAALLAFAAIVTLEVYGIGTGGDFANSLWQMRPLMWTPCMAFVAAATLDVRLRHWLRVIVMFAATTKSLEALFVYYRLREKFRGQAVEIKYVTTHSDSPLFALAIVLCVIYWFEHRAPRRRWLLVAAPMLFSLAMTFNNRRIAWVAVGGGLAFCVGMARFGVKRSFLKLLALTWPLLLAYAVLGWRAGAPSVFKPVKMVRSVVLQDDRSSSTRDVENFNVSFTFRQNPLFGTGFGHEYIELVRGDDISKDFAQYRFIPHNSLLGLWAFGGILGAGMFWLPLVVAITYAVQSLRTTRFGMVRVDALFAVCAVIAYMVQAWGDMGLQDWVTVALGACGCGIAARMGVERRAELDAAIAAPDAPVTFASSLASSFASSTVAPTSVTSAGGV